MDKFDLFVFARAIHITAVVIWIGGVAFITTVLLPAIRTIDSPEKRMALFEQLEDKFAFQAKITTIAAGASGFYMLEFLNAWDRYMQVQFWWMHLMTLVWAIFTLVLFVLEPLILHRWFKEQARKDSEATFNKIQTMHIFLLSLSIIAVVGAMLGAHGYQY